MGLGFGPTMQDGMGETSKDIVLVGSKGGKEGRREGGGREREGERIIHVYNLSIWEGG